MPGHRGYGSTEADKLSKEVIYGKLEALIPEEERRTNGHSGDGDPTEDAGRGSEPDSPSSPGWDQVPRSPSLDLGSFQGEVEEGVLVNVSGSPGDVLEELGCLELDDVVDDEDDGVNDITEGQTSVQTQKDSPHEEESARHKGNCNSEFSAFESFADSNGIHKDNGSSHPSSPDINNLNQTEPGDSEDPDRKSVSDGELAKFLKTNNSSD